MNTVLVVVVVVVDEVVSSQQQAVGVEKAAGVDSRCGQVPARVDKAVRATTTLSSSKHLLVASARL